MKRSMINIKVYNILVSLILLLFVISGVSSCVTQNSNIRMKHTIKKLITDSGVYIVLEYLPEERLKELFGKINNPFLSPVSFLKSNKLMVYYLNIVNRSDRDISMHLNSLELQFEGVNSKPYNRFQLYNFWEPRIGRQPDYKRWNASIIRSIINKNVFDNDTVIKYGEEREGYVVFKGPFPDYGRAVVYLIFYDESGRLIKRYELVFEF